MCDWIAFLGQTLTVTGTLRSTNTVESSARSARAWCQWLVCQQFVTQTPFASLSLHKGGTRPLHLIEAEEWEQLLLACRTARKRSVLAEQMTARDCAVLWVLFETGMHLVEVCRLRLSDVNAQEGVLRVKGKGSQERQITLGANGRCAVLFYLEEHRPKLEARPDKEEHLFLSDTGCPLSMNAFSLVFRRLKKRAGITRRVVCPSLLRESFAVRYLHAGGDLLTLRNLLGMEESAVVKRFVRMSDEGMKNNTRKE